MKKILKNFIIFFAIQIISITIPKIKNTNTAPFNSQFIATRIVKKIIAITLRINHTIEDLFCFFITFSPFLERIKKMNTQIVFLDINIVSY